MAASNKPILTMGVLVITTAAVEKRAVAATGALPAAAAACLGFAEISAAIGERVPVTVMGTAAAEAGAAIAANAAVELDSLGRVVTKSAGVTVGRLAPGYTAGAAGDVVEVIMLPS